MLPFNSKSFHFILDRSYTLPSTGNLGMILLAFSEFGPNFSTQDFLSVLQCEWPPQHMNVLISLIRLDGLVTNSSFLSLLDCF